jgi:hypothetical protein
MRSLLALGITLCLGFNCSGGLLGYWNFDEASGSIVLDRAGTNNGTVYNGSYVPGRFGLSALRFNGSSTFVLVGAEDSKLTLTNSPYSITWWQRWAGQNGQQIQRIVNMDDGLNLAGGYATFVFSGTLAFSHNNGTDQNWFTGAQPVVGIWESFAIVYDGVRRHLYKDGELLESTPTGASLGSDLDDPLLFGAISTGASITQFFNGDLDEIRIYNHALTQGQVQAVQSNVTLRFVSEPRSQTVTQGSTATLTAEGESLDGTPLSYQWLRRGIEIPGATSTVLITEPLTNLETISFSVRIQNTGMAVSSPEVAVNVATAPLPAPLASWGFDEASGSGVADEQGIFHGSLVNAERIAGRVGRGAIHLNGTNAYVSIGAIGSKLSLTNSPYTISWWQRWRGPNGRFQEILAMDDAADYSGGYAFLISPQGALMAVHNNGLNQHWIPGLALKTNDWQHIAVIWNGQTRRIFLNSELHSEKQTSGYLRTDGDDPLLFGAADQPCCGPSLFYNGDLDEIKIFGAALTDDQIKILATSDNSFASAGLVASYPLDGDARDASSNNLHGVIFDASPSEDRFGRPNSALSFNGTSSYINCGNFPQFNFNESFTLAAWVKLTGPCTNRFIIAKYIDLEGGNKSLHSYGLGVGPQSQTYGFVSSNSTSSVQAFGGPSLNDTQWHSVAFVYDRSYGLRLYTDGGLVTTTPAANLPQFTNAVPFTIGSASSGQFFAGAMDDVRIYNRALAASEVSALYATDIQSGLSLSRAVKLTLSTIVGRRYKLEGSADLISWRPLGSSFVATDTLSAIYVDAEDSDNYFRLNVLFP